MEASQSSRHVRGPHLAKLELIRRLRSQGCNDEYKLGKKVTGTSWVRDPQEVLSPGEGERLHPISMLNMLIT